MAAVEEGRSSNEAGKLPNAGPFLAKIVNNISPLRMGELEVQLIREVGNDENDPGQTFKVKYLSPFYGVMSVDYIDSNGNGNTYNNAQKSYGMWMVPPDVGVTVMVIFVEGDTRRGYWMGCVMDEGMNFMVPGNAASYNTDNRSLEDGGGSRPDEIRNIMGPSTNTDEAGNVLELFERAPVTEYKKIPEDVEEPEPGSAPGGAKPPGASTTALDELPHPSTPLEKILFDQGLLRDDARGITSSSARRESPSMVFGISTPGPLDKGPNSGKTKVGPTGEENLMFVSRLGGSTFVMDDGCDRFIRKTHASKGPAEYFDMLTDLPPDDPDKEEQPDTIAADKTIPHNELIRLRTRTGHQIVLHNSEDLIYIGNARGTAWIELSSDGKIDIFAKDSISIRTESDFNFSADRDFNIAAGRNINMSAVNEIHLASKQNKIITKEHKITVTGNVEELYMKDHTMEVYGNSKTLVKKDNWLNIVGNSKLRINGKENIEVKGESTKLVTGARKDTTKGGLHFKTTGVNNFTSSGITNIKASKAMITASGNIEMKAGGGLVIGASGTASMKSTGAFAINASKIDLNAGGGTDPASAADAAAAAAVSANVMLAPVYPLRAHFLPIEVSTDSVYDRSKFTGVTLVGSGTEESFAVQGPPGGQPPDTTLGKSREEYQQGAQPKTTDDASVVPSSIGYFYNPSYGRKSQNNDQIADLFVPPIPASNNWWCICDDETFLNHYMIKTLTDDFSSGEFTTTFAAGKKILAPLLGLSGEEKIKETGNDGAEYELDLGELAFLSAISSATVSLDDMSAHVLSNGKTFGEYRQLLVSQPSITGDINEAAALTQQYWTSKGFTQEDVVEANSLSATNVSLQLWNWGATYFDIEFYGKSTTAEVSGIDPRTGEISTTRSSPKRQTLAKFVNGYADNPYDQLKLDYIKDHPDEMADIRNKWRKQYPGSQAGADNAKSTYEDYEDTSGYDGSTDNPETSTSNTSSIGYSYTIKERGNYNWSSREVVEGTYASPFVPPTPVSDNWWCVTDDIHLLRDLRVWCALQNDNFATFMRMAEKVLQPILGKSREGTVTVTGNDGNTYVLDLGRMAFWYGYGLPDRDQSIDAHVLSNGKKMSEYYVVIRNQPTTSGALNDTKLEEYYSSKGFTKDDIVEASRINARNNSELWNWSIYFNMKEFGVNYDPSLISNETAQMAAYLDGLAQGRENPAQMQAEIDYILANTDQMEDIRRNWRTKYPNATVQDDIVQPKSESGGQQNPQQPSAPTKNTPTIVSKVFDDNVITGTSITRRKPTVEPYKHHENLDPDKFRTAATDRDAEGRYAGETIISGDPVKGFKVASQKVFAPTKTLQEPGKSWMKYGHDQDATNFPDPLPNADDE